MFQMLEVVNLALTSSYARTKIKRKSDIIAQKHTHTQKPRVSALNTVQGKGYFIPVPILKLFHAGNVKL